MIEDLIKESSMAEKTLEDLMKNFKKLKGTEVDKIFFKNNCGGHLNHSLF